MLLYAADCRFSALIEINLEIVVRRSFKEHVSVILQNNLDIRMLRSTNVYKFTNVYIHDVTGSVCLILGNISNVCDWIRNVFCYKQNTVVVVVVFFV